MIKVEVQQAGAPDDEQRIAVLDAIGSALASKRKDAIAARSQSGIETEWAEDEESYQGYDDANRHEFANTASKPVIDGKTRNDNGKVASSGSTVFPNITQPYCDAVAARYADMVLPTDDRNFALEPIKDNNIAPAPLPVPQPPPPPAQPGQPPAPLTPQDQARIAQARFKANNSRKAKLAEDQIDDWLQASGYNGEMRHVIDDSVRLGSGVIKGPVPTKRKLSKWVQGADGVSEMKVIDEIQPESLRIDPWNLFPDPACGESIHNGSYIFERDYITEKKLDDLRGLPGYIDSQIDKCILEGPGNRKEGGRNNKSSSKDQYEIWYAHIEIKADELVACGCEVEGKKSYPALMTMVNNHVIRAALNPMDSGEFPYEIIPWKRRPGMPWGMGLARQLRTPQRMVTAATRRLADNAGLGSGPMFVVRRGVQPENGIWEIAPLKVWVEEDDSTGNATAPVSAVVIPMMQVELTNIIQLGMKMAEDVTGMPQLMQGNQGSAPDTVGGMTILNNNANSVLRRMARVFDIGQSAVINKYYAWMMEYGEDDRMKGEFQIVARASTALVERDIQSQEMVNVLQMSLNPAYGKNPKLAMNEYLKSRRFDPSAFDYTEEELAKMQSNQQPPDPRIQVAQMNAQAKAQEQQAKIKADADHAAADYAYQKWEKDMEIQMEQEKLAADKAQAFDDHKVDMASLSMKLRTQAALSERSIAHQKDTTVGQHAMDMHNNQVMQPVVEPAGQAAPGEAYQS
jgi:hypothetical protein